MRDKIFADANEMLKQGKKTNLAVLRMVKTAILEKEREFKKKLDDEKVLDVITNQIKTRKESLEQFKNANRSDLEEQTQKEIDFLNQYLPKQLSSLELDEIIEEVFQNLQPTGKQDMGLIMKTIMPKVRGRVDMGEVNKKIKEKLGG